eukprot:gene1373-1563_t
MKRHHKSRSRSGGSKRSSKKHRSKRTRSRSNDSSGDEWLKLKAKRKAEKANEGTKQWDKPPEGLSELSLQEAALAIKPLMLQATMIAASPQQNRQARRLYVGNITPAAHENQIAQFFNIHLANTGKCFHIPPVSNVQIHIEKAFAFVEFVRVEDATLCMALDGIIFENQKVKIRRPKDYIPIPGLPSDPDQIVHDLVIPGVVSTTVKDTPFKVYLGNIPTNLTDAQVQTLVSAFGQLRSFHLVT